MFRPRPMVQVEILLLQRDLKVALHALAAARILHLQSRSALGVEGGRESWQAPEILDRQLALQALLRHSMEELAIAPSPASPLETVDLAEWEEWAEALQRSLERLQQRRRQLLRRRDVLRYISFFLRRLKGVTAGFADLGALRFTTVQLVLLPVSALAEIVREAPATAIFPLRQIGASLLLACILPSRKQAELEQRLVEQGGTVLPLPQRVGGSFADNLRRVLRLHRRVRIQLRRLEDKVHVLRRQHESLLRDRLFTLSTENRLLRAGAAFGFTHRAVAIGGWVPRRRYAELQEILHDCCADRFLLRRSVASGEDAPVLFFNPALLRPFQRLLAILGTPTYSEIEPTPLLAVGFLVLFGLMFGDVGHGLVLILSGAILRRFTRFRDPGLVAVEVGVFALLFGLLFGSFFGREDLFAPFWFSPLHDIPRLMTVTLSLGAGLILTGLALRIVNGLRSERVWLVLTDRYGGAGLLFYAGSLLGGILVARGALSPAALGWLALPLVAVFLHPFARRESTEWAAWPLLLAEGVIEVMETVLGFLANTFSFLRVAAFGLAHAGLFIAVFALADEVSTLPFGRFWVVLVHLLGNLVILVLEGLVVSVQAVRLEFYEIFSKFFRGGGVVYEPLTLEGGHERRNGDAQ